LKDIDLTAALTHARSAVSDRGDSLRQAFGAVAHSRKPGSATNVVTTLDVETEERLAEALQTFDPGITVCGEELGGDRKGTFWLIDPIDGTGHFVRGIPLCTTMVALVDDDRPVAAIIYDFVRDRMYHAALGQGAYVNDEPIHVSDRNLSASYLSVEIDTSKGDNLTMFRTLQSHTVMFNSLNAGWEYAMIAEGRLEGRLCLDPFGNDYDYAPGALLVSEAGGAASNIGSTSYRVSDTNVIIANPVVHAEVTAVLSGGR
jgi:fructose-1,6-bisphosphatase/inositol monophosphatase family enzyme